MKKYLQEVQNLKNKKNFLEYKCKMHLKEKINIKINYNNMKEKLID